MCFARTPFTGSELKIKAAERRLLTSGKVLFPATTLILINYSKTIGRRILNVSVTGDLGFAFGAKYKVVSICYS